MSAKWPSPIYTQPGPSATGVYNTSAPINDEADLIGSGAFGGISGSGLVDEPEATISAHQWAGVNDTFYNRILIDPSQLDMGNLLSNQTRVIEVWNGFIGAKTLQGFQRLNDAGISVAEPVTLPYQLRPLEQLNYVLSITTDGPAVIDAQYVWTVDGVDYSAAVTGRRVVVWPFGPNWNAEVTEILEWLTNILRSFDGSEQRRSIRTKARRTFSYTFQTARHESARAENLLWGWQNRIYALPVWTDKSKLDDDQVQGDTVISLPTETYCFTAGGLAAFFADASNIEVAEIDTVNPGNLVLKHPLENNWPEGTTVMPVVLGHLPTSVPLVRRSSQALVGVLTFTCDPVSVDPFTPDAVPQVTYDGLEVLQRQPNWGESLSNDFQYQFDTVDQTTGAIGWDQTEEFPRIQRTYPWLLNGRQQILGFRQLLGRLRGQAKTLYVPTWHDDFVVTRPIGAADVGISVLDNEFRQMVGVDPMRDRVMIRLKDGTNFYRRIVGISTDGAYTILTIDAPLNREVPLGQVKTVHLLMRSRLAADSITLSWRSGRVAVVNTSFITVKE